MATKNAALRDLQADALGDVLDSATLKIYTSGNVTLLATFTLPAAAFNPSSAGVITLNGVPLQVTAAAAGTAAVADLESTGATYTVTGLTVGTSGTRIILDNLVISAGQKVNLNSMTWTESTGTT